MARYSVQHITRYEYEYPVVLSHHSAHLEPKNLIDQTCESFSLVTDPEFQDYRTRVDYFGNTYGLFSIQQDHSVLTVESQSIVQVNRQVPDLLLQTVTTKESREIFSRPQSDFTAQQYLYGSTYVHREPVKPILDYAKHIFTDKKPIVEGCRELMQDIRDNFTFDNQATDTTTTVEEFFKEKRGVCQDFTHFALTVLCSVGIPCRYVSGYILTQPPPGKPRLEGADASHAWVSMYLPHYGWIDFDPTNNLFCADQHVTVAWGRDFDDVSMIRGAITGGGEHKLNVSVTMKPYEG